MEEDENDVPFNDPGDDIPQNKNKKGNFISSKPKELLVVLICAIIVLIIYLVFIISYIRNEKKDIIPTSEPLGKINCIYILENEDESTNILNKNFSIPEKFDIYIDNEKINLTDEYKLKGKKEYNVTYFIYNDLDMKDMFKNILFLKEVKMNSEKNCNIISMESAFENCENLESFYIKGFNTKKIVSLKKLFYQTSLKNVEFNDFNSESVIDVSYMFSSSSIENIDLSFLHKNKVEYMNHMFSSCTSLTSLDLSKINTSYVKDINNMLGHCESLSSINLDNFKTNLITNMSAVFEGCIKLKKINVD
jgi:surface protein